jgi:hypothetical protein
VRKQVSGVRKNRDDAREIFLRPETDALVEQKLPCHNCDKDGYADDVGDHSSVLKLFVHMHKYLA